MIFKKKYFVTILSVLTIVVLFAFQNCGNPIENAQKLSNADELKCAILGDCSSDKINKQSKVKTKIYVNFVFHGGWSGVKDNIPNGESKEFYLSRRKALIAIADLMIKKKAAWDFQANWVFAVRAKQWENSDVISNTVYGDTKGKNILQYLAEVDSNRISVEPTMHSDSSIQSYYKDNNAKLTAAEQFDINTLQELGIPDSAINTNFNYTDAMYIYEQMGAPQSHGVVGGFLIGSSVPSPSSTMQVATLKNFLKPMQYV